MVLAIHDVCFKSLSEMLEMNQWLHPKIIPKPDENRQPLVQRPQRAEPPIIQRDRRHDLIVALLFGFIVFFNKRKNFIQPTLQRRRAIALDFISLRPVLRDLSEARARSGAGRKSIRSAWRARLDMLDQTQQILFQVAESHRHGSAVE